MKKIFCIIMMLVLLTVGGCAKAPGYTAEPAADEPSLSFDQERYTTVRYVGDDFVVLHYDSVNIQHYIKVPTDLKKTDIAVGDGIYIKGGIYEIETAEQYGGYTVTHTASEDVISQIAVDDMESVVNGGASVVAVADDGIIVEYQRRICKLKPENISGFCVGDYISFSGKGRRLDTPVEQGGYTVTYIYDGAAVTEPELIESKKPVIYLYPEKTTDVTVSVDFYGELTCVYPAYDGGKWQVSASPDGTLTDKNGRTYYCLYWEGESDLSLLPDETVGFIVKGSDTAEFLREKALQLGLNEKEANEFIIYWLPLMQQNEYNYVYFAIDGYKSAVPLDITPAADTVIRFSMLWKAVDEPFAVTEQVLPKTPERNGFTVVEWGGSIID